MEAPQGERWVPVLPAGELPEAKAMRVTADGVDVVLYRAGEWIFALANRCSHQGGPLHKGVVRPSGSNPTVTCPVHGSIFRLTDGKVVRGPAIVPQAVYEARANDDVIEVRPA